LDKVYIGEFVDPMFELKVPPTNPSPFSGGGCALNVSGYSTQKANLGLQYCIYLSVSLKLVIKNIANSEAKVFRICLVRLPVRVQMCCAYL